MKLYTAVIAFSILMSWFSVHAVENVQVIDAEQTPVTATVYKNSSEHNRMNKTWTMQYQLFGSGPNGTAEGAGIIGYHLNRNSVVQIEVGSGGSSSPTIFLGNVEYSGSTVGVHYKHFFGNSFYVKTGIDYRSVKFEYQSAFSTSRESFEGTSVGAGFVIGNQWQWENFTLGCDWIGISVPFASTITSEQAASWDFDNTSLRDDQERYLHNAYAQALRFYVGYTF